MKHNILAIKEYHYLLKLEKHKKIEIKRQAKKFRELTSPEAILTFYREKENET